MMALTLQTKLCRHRDLITPFVDPFPGLITPVLVLEGGYVNDPADGGGPTNYGVTLAVARAAGYADPLQDMTQVQAIAIYRHMYWQQPQFDRLYPTFPALAEFLLNIGINMGPVTVSMFLQRALNGLNDGGLFVPLDTDGVCGQVTRTALIAYKIARGDGDGFAVLLGLVRGLVICRYLELAETTPRDRRFEYGWLRRAILS